MITTAERALAGRVPPARRRWWTRFWPYVTVILVFAVSRLFYRFGLDLQFDYTPIYYFVQYLSPWFVRHDFLRSLLYLHQQAPLQNVLTGGCLRIFGVPAAFTALAAIYAALGIATALGMLHAMLRLGAARPIAAVSAALHAASPAAAFYGNWLFYQVPVTALLTLSLVSLLRYYRIGSFGAGLCFFSLFATTSLFYAVLNPVLLVGATLALLVRPPVPTPWRGSPRARMLLALCIPLLVLGLDKARTQVLVGHSQGNALLWVNLEIKTFFQLQRDELAMLERRGIIPMTPDPAYLSALPSSHGALRVPHSPTGIPLLDLESTPDGSMNAHAIEIVLIAEKHYKREALSLLQNVPAAYFRAVLSALTHDYFLSPFEAADSINRLKLEAFNGRMEKLLLPDRDGLPRLLVIALPMTLLYGIYRVFG